MRKLAIWLLTLFLLISLASAISVVPSRKEMQFSPGEHRFQIKVGNDDSQDLIIEITPEGSFAQYVGLIDRQFELKKGESKVIDFTISLPNSISTPGIHETRMVIKSMPKGSEENPANIISAVGVVSKVLIKVPYPGKYAEIRMFVPNFDNQEASNFALEITNLGDENIVDARAVIEVLGPLNNNLETLQTESVFLKPKESKRLFIPWQPDLNNGRYIAKATLIYDGQNAFDQREFTIGQKFLEILGISVSSFRLGQIAQFDILVSSNWNEIIKGVMADVSVKDKEDNVYALSRTIEEDVQPYGKQVLKAYWNTENVEQGDYLLDITLNYLGKITNKVFDIYVGLDEIITKGVGQVISATQEAVMDRNTFFFAAAILGLVGVNIVLMVVVLKRRK